VKRILVTGASGLLGLTISLTAAASEPFARHGNGAEPYEVWGGLRNERLAQAVPAGPKQAASPVPFHPLYGDLTQAGQIERMLDQAQPEVVIHCAAMTEVDRCEVYPEQAQLLNADVPRALARITARQGIRMVQISTDAVFDGTQGSYCEDHPTHPLNVYGRTKLSGERAVAEENPDALVARVNFYGWSWQGRRSLAEFFYNQLASGERVDGFNDIVFSPLLVNDLARVLLRMVELRLSGLYHVVSSESQSKFAFGRMLARQFGFNEQSIHPASYKTANLRAPRARLLSLNSDKLAHALGQPLPGQGESMARFHALFLQGYRQRLQNLFVANN
jgi:dTDP-4-dehydrorhamnose reductase